MAIKLLDHKTERVTGITGSNAWQWQPWDFFALGLTNRARIIIDWDITGIAADEDTGSSYPLYYAKKWVLSVKVTSSTYLVINSRTTIAVAIHSDFGLFEDYYVRFTAQGISRQWTFFGSARMAAFTEV